MDACMDIISDNLDHLHLGTESCNIPFYKKCSKQSKIRDSVQATNTFKDLDKFLQLPPKNFSKKFFCITL